MKARMAQLPTRHLKLSMPDSQKKKRRKVLRARNLLNKNCTKNLLTRNVLKKHQSDSTLCNINFLCIEKIIISIEYNETRKLQQLEIVRDYFANLPHRKNFKSTDGKSNNVERFN